MKNKQYITMPMERFIYMIQSIEKLTKENIEYLEELKFLLEMVDRWTDFDRVSFDALCELINEVKNKNEI